MMVGREIEAQDREKTPRDGFALEVSHLSREALKDISLNVRRGEIVGPRGRRLRRTELAQAVRRPRRDRQVSICGKPVANPAPMKCIRQKMGFISKSRRSSAGAEPADPREHHARGARDNLPPASSTSRRAQNRRGIPKEAAHETPDVERDVKGALGGTQQKVAREVALDRLRVPRVRRADARHRRRREGDTQHDRRPRGEGRHSDDLVKPAEVFDALRPHRDARRPSSAIDHEGVMQEVIACATGVRRREEALSRQIPMTRCCSRWSLFAIFVGLRKYLAVEHRERHRAVHERRRHRHARVVPRDRRPASTCRWAASCRCPAC